MLGQTTLNNPCRGYYQGNNYGQFRVRSCGRGRGNYHGCGYGRSNYRGNNNYQYHQYYDHDNDNSLINMAHHVHYAVVIITPPKHCFKGEHYINNIMEKMYTSGHQSQQRGLY